MGTRYRDYNPEQAFLLPPSPSDWLPEEHLAYFIADTLDSLDLSSFHTRYEGDGRRNRPYHPAMMLKVLVYAYATGVFSSRKIARKIDEDVALRVLAAGNRPDFRTINRFRCEQLEEFKTLFIEIVRLAKRSGLLKLGTVALDGTKVKANASKHKAMSYKRMQEDEARLVAEIAELLERAERIDAAEDEQYGEASGDEIPDEFKRRASRLARIRKEKAALEAEQAAADSAQARSPDDERMAGGKRPQGGRSKFKRKFGEPPPKAQRNFTDRESKIMKTGKGFEQCYNAQAVVEEGEQLIVTTALGSNAADNGYLIELLDEVKANTGVKPKRALADAGYKGERNFEELEGRGIRGYVALGRESNKGGEAQAKAGGEATARMRKRLKDQRGRRRYWRRKALVEPAFGWVKRVLGFREFSMRGLENVQGEWNLVTAALNLRRMSRMTPLPQGT